MIDITGFPNLEKTLIDVINVPSDELQHFQVPTLSVFEREALKLAYVKDATEDEIASIIDGEAVAKEVKRGISADIAMQDSIFERIYDLAQEMQPILEQIAKYNHEAGE